MDGLAFGLQALNKLKPIINPPPARELVFIKDLLLNVIDVFCVDILIFFLLVHYAILLAAISTAL